MSSHDQAARVVPLRSRPSVRDRMLALVAERPGITLGELKLQLRIGWGTLYHHLRALELEERVASSAVGRRKILAPAHAGETTNAVLALLRGETARRVARQLAHARSTTVRELADALTITPRVARYHLLQLARHGLVVRKRGLQLRYEAALPLLQLNARDLAPDAPAPHDEAHAQASTSVAEPKSTL